MIEYLEPNPTFDEEHDDVEFDWKMELMETLLPCPLWAREANVEAAMQAQQEDKASEIFGSPQSPRTFVKE